MKAFTVSPDKDSSPRLPGIKRHGVSRIFALCFLVSALLAHSAFAMEADIPKSILVKGKEVFLKELKNPLRIDTGNLKKHIREGGDIYFKHCYLCHGDLLDGAGVFGDRFYPQPADLRKSVLDRPESYAYWRIMKGGRGLPDKFNPWDSAMPTWEDTLTEDQAWKVILFIYETARDTRKSASPDKPSVERGKEIYHEKCAYCHGETGNGDGPAANFSSPRPRKLTKTMYKIRTTHFGKIPTDQDIFDIISKGMPGTTMPSWKHLPETDRWSLVFYLKTLANKFERFYAKGETLETVIVGEPPPSTPEGLAEGKDLFIKNCSGCHGLEGRSDGKSTERIVDIASDAIWPRNLTKPWLFRRGSALKDMFLTIRTGLSGTAMPRFLEKTLNDQQAWNLLHYVKTLATSENRPDIRPIHAKKVSGEIPIDPEDPVWKNGNPYFFPLGGQIIQSNKLYYTTTDSVIVKALYSDNEIAIHLSWDDPTFDPALKNLADIKDSPPPPLPPEMQQGGDAGETTEDEDDKSRSPFPDAIAIQFPVHPDERKPCFLNGDSEQPVNLWKWSSRPMGAVELKAKGMDNISVQPKESQGVATKVTYRYGSYHLVMKRKSTTADKDNDIQFNSGQKTPIAFNIWNGSAKETGSQMAVSSWFQLTIE